MNNKYKIDKENIIEFPQGLMGYPNYKRFFIWKSSLVSPFSYLVSVENPQLFFLIMSPYLLDINIEVDISKKHKDFLGISDPKDVNYFGIVSIPDEPEMISINLKMPLVINFIAKKGAHLFNQRKYPVKYYLFYQLNELKNKLSQ